MTRRNQAAPVKESYASELRILRCFHLRQHVHLLIVPQYNRIVKTGRYYLRCVRNLLILESRKPTRLQSYDFQDGACVSRHTLLLLLLLQSEAFHDEVLVHKQTSVAGAFGVTNDLDAVYLSVDFLPGFSFLLSEILDDYLVFVVNVNYVDEAAVVSCVETAVVCVPK